MSEDRPVVLIVEDEPPLVEIYTRWLEGEYQVRAAQGGEEALSKIDESVAVVLLDRLMPEMTGDEVLAEFRDRGYGVSVAMVTAVEPDFDLITMGVDAYLTKPVDKDEMHETVARLIQRRGVPGLEREYFQLVAKKAALQTSKDEATLQSSDEFSELEERITAVRAELDEQTVDDDAEFIARIRDITADSGTDLPDLDGPSDEVGDSDDQSDGDGSASNGDDGGADVDADRGGGGV